MRFYLYIATCLLLALAGDTSAEEKMQTGSKPNGVYWLSLDRDSRRAMLEGIFTGLAMGMSYGDMSTETGAKLIRTGMTFDDLITTFNKFYSEAPNRRIPIESAWLFAVARAADVPEESVSKMVGDLRAVVNGDAQPSVGVLPTKHPEVYDIALNHAERSKTLTIHLGAEWEASNERANAWTLGPDDGHAYVFIDLTGPKGAGRLNGHAKRVGGRWVYDSLDVLVIGTGTTVDILGDKEQ